MNICLQVRILIVLILLLFSGACAKPQTPDIPGDVAEIHPGILQGYLATDAYPNSLALIPPPPIEGSAAMALDEATSQSALALKGSKRWALAIQDADLSFPSAAGTFSCALNVAITEQQTPHIYMLMRRTLADAGLSTYTAKNHYQRIRPFVVNRQATCTPEDESELKADGSYPSGHTAIGWAWALILTELAPDRADEILARGRAFGQSRLVCNVHWHSDVLEGRFMGAAAVARLHGNPIFQARMEAAKAELAVVKAKGITPIRDCRLEAEAMLL